MPRSAASASTCSKRRRNFCVAAAQAGFGIDVEVAGDVDDREQQVAQLVGGGVGVAAAGSAHQLVGFLRDLRQRTVHVRPVEADLRSLLLHLVGEREGGQRAGDAVEDRRALLRRSLFLEALDRLPVAEHLTDAVDLGQVAAQFAQRSIAEHVGVPAHELVVHAAGDVGDREPPLLLGDRRVELDLVQQVAELLDQRLVAGRVVGVELLDRIDHLVRLLDEVRDQGTVRLLDVPRAPFTERAGELVETDIPIGDRRAQRRDVQAGQVIGLDRAVHVGPGRLDDRLVVGAKAAQQDDRCQIERAGGVVDAQLDVGEHPVGVGVGDEQRPGRPGCRRGELVAVDEPNRCLDRVDAEPRPRDVEERHRRQQGALDAFVGEQRSHRAFEHEWRARDGVQHLAVLERRRDEALGDLGVDVGEPVGGLVQLVERDRIGNEVGTRVPAGAQVTALDATDGGERFGGDLPAAARPEPYHDDASGSGGHVS